MPRGAVVEKVCEYMAFKTYYDNASANASVEIPVNEFMERIPPEVALELYVSLPCSNPDRTRLLTGRVCWHSVAGYWWQIISTV